MNKLKILICKDMLIKYAVVVLTIIFIVVGNATIGYEFNETTQDFAFATILQVGEPIMEELSSSDGTVTVLNKQIPFRAQVSSGWADGTIVEGFQMIDMVFTVQQDEIEVGSAVILNYYIDTETEAGTWQFADHNRITPTLMLVTAFLLIILIIGKWKGVSTVLSLGFTCAIIILVYIPAILSSVNIYLLTIVVCVAIIFMSLILINGVNPKTISAIVGNIGGVLVAGVLATIMSVLLSLTGIAESDYIMLTYLETPLDLKALVWSGVVIGSLGAVMDVAMTISSAMNEVYEEMQEKKMSQLIRSGMTVGTDAIGTMTNTLILAYIGSSLAVVLLQVNYQTNLIMLFNLEMIATEIMQAVVGSIGILFAVPITVISTAYILHITNKSRRKIHE